MSIKSILLVTTIIYIWTSNGANSYKTYNNRYTVASTSGASSGQSPDDNHPNDIITIEDEEGIPMDEFKKFNNISTLEELYQMFGDGEEQTDLPYDSLSELGTNLGRSSVLIPPKAKCEPRDTVVDIVPENEAGKAIYFPGCIIAKRCSGCCSPKELMSCQPIDNATSYINYSVVVADYDSKSGHTRIRPRRQLIPVLQHDSCSCQCIVKEKDCISNQSYDPHNCRCLCSNVEAKEKCERNNDKIWVPQTCTCRCRNQAICTSGTVFDENICACSANRRNRIVSPILVDPSTNTQYTVGG